MEDIFKVSMEITPLIIIILSAFGVVWGDFIGMMVVRTTHQVGLITAGKEPERQGIKLYGGRSHCMSCNTKIPWYYNIPLLGWLHLKGNSACCSTRISKVYPATELFFLIAFPLSFMYFSPAASALFLTALTICYVASYVDLKTMHIPIEGNYLLLLISMFVMVIYNPDPADKMVYVIIAWLAIHLINSISPQQVIGEGDIPIIVSIILISFAYLFNIAVIIASAVTIAIFAYNMIKHKSYSLARMVPFGPGLCVAYLVALTMVLKEITFT